MTKEEAQAATVAALDSMSPNEWGAVARVTTGIGGRRMDQERKAYERFRLQWMLDHGRTLTELIGELQKLRDEGDPEMSLQDLFRDWEFGYGFGSEIWPCFEEFLDVEYKMPEGKNPDVAYRGKLTLDELMMGDPVGAEPECQPHPRKNRQRGGER